MLSITLVILILTVLVCSSNDYLLETRLQNSAQKQAKCKTFPDAYIKKNTQSQSSSNSSADSTPRGRLDWGCDWCRSLSFGRVSGLCQVLITVECWHEFSAALQSNKKSQAEQAKVPQPPLELHDSYSASQAQTLAIFLCPAVLLHSCRPPTGDLSMFLTGNWSTDCPFLLRSANRDRDALLPLHLWPCALRKTQPLATRN